MRGERHDEGDAAERVARFGSPDLQVIFAVTLVAVLGVSTISPALPRIQQALGITAHQVGLLITVFTLPGVIMTPLLGILADRIGRRRVLVPALLLFSVAGAACSLVRSLELLVVLRFLQGVGAAPLGSLNVTLIGDLYQGHQRTAAMGYNASVLSVGTTIYPAIGGALAMLGWHYPFALPLCALPVALLVMARLRAPEPRRQQRFSEYMGEVLRGVRSTEVLVLFVASTVVFVLLYGPYITCLPLIMDRRFAASPLAIGLVMSTLSITAAITTSQLGRMVRWMPERVIPRAGFVLVATALAVVPAVGSMRMMLAPALLLGAGLATTIPTVQSIIAGLAPSRHRAAFMSLNGMVLRLGQTVGPLAATAVYSAWGFDWVYLLGAVLAVLMAGIMVLLVRPPSPAAPGD